jgi:hypothetical protein
MILQIPNRDASGAIFFIYRNGSFHSASDGRYVGASCRPCGRIFLLVSRLAVGWPRRSTDVGSRGADFMALSGCGAAAGLELEEALLGGGCLGRLVRGVEEEEVVVLGKGLA